MGLILKQFWRDRRQTFQSYFLSCYLQVPTPSAQLHCLPTPLFIYVHHRQIQTHLGVCEWGTSDAFHIAASLIALFTTKDNCSLVQWRIIRPMLCCACAIGVICSAEKATGWQLFTCGEQKADIDVQGFDMCQAQGESKSPHFGLVNYGLFLG